MTQGSKHIFYQISPLCMCLRPTFMIFEVDQNFAPCPCFLHFFHIHFSVVATPSAFKVEREVVLGHVFNLSSHQNTIGDWNLTDSKKCSLQGYASANLLHFVHIWKYKSQFIWKMWFFYQIGQRHYIASGFPRLLIPKTLECLYHPSLRYPVPFNIFW